MKIVLVCGPPRSGKDELGRSLKNLVARVSSKTGVVTVKFAYVLKQAVHRAFDLQGIDAEAFDDRKDVPSEAFHGATPRAAYIQFSEHFAKPLFGSRYFGERLASILEPYDGHVALVVVTDSGFAEEAQALVDRFGVKDVCLVRLSRPGASFEGDSRSYWQPPDGMRVLTLRNDGPLESLELLSRRVLEFAGVSL